MTQDIFERQPPFSLEAELGVLGSIFLLPDCADDVALILRPDDFYDDANRKIYGHLSEMYQSGKRIDITLLVDRLKKAGDFEAVGGAAYLGQVSQAVPNPAHAVYYANIVKENSTLRRLIDIGSEVLRDAYGNVLDAKQLSERTEREVFSLMESGTTAREVSIRDALHEAMDRIDARIRGEVAGSVETGFTDVDKMTGGLHDQELVILAARPAMGKSSYALNIAEQAAIRAHPVLLISLEMSQAELTDRLLCGHARVNGHRARNGTLSQEDRGRLVTSAGLMSQWPLWIEDKASMTVVEIASMARRLKRQKGLDLLIIDYLQLIEPENTKDNRQEQVAKISRRLKGLAKELDVPVLCLCQLNRAAETGTQLVPRLSHLRESGAIEQDSDVVMFVHRPEYYMSEEQAQQYAGHAELYIAKQRNGPTGKVDLVWRKEYTRFEDYAPHRFDDQHRWF